MQSLIFKNDGEIDIRSILTFGCSVKESKNPIGWFGTGLKFGLAVLLRTSHEVTVLSGLTEYTITKRTENIRGKDFDLVYINDQPAGFTTELGKNWEVWMAYRELYCNATDEPNHVVEIVDEDVIPQSGYTIIKVVGAEIVTCHRNKSEFILDSKPIFVLDDIEVHARPSKNFFYKGIKVHQFENPCMFTYNQTSHVELTEDRTVKNQGVVPHTISQKMLQHGEKALLKDVLTCSNNFQEHFFDFHWSYDPSADFFPTIGELQRSELTKINQSALRLWREKAGGIMSPRRVNLTNVQSMMVEKAIAFCEKSGIQLRAEFPILIVETLGEDGVLATADLKNKQIFITEAVLHKGTKYVARALIEEYWHLRFGVRDCSREMQNLLFDKMISLAEELNGEPL